MHLLKRLLPIVLILPLAGFSDAKMSKLVDHCVKHGSTEASCRCTLKIVEDQVGEAFLEAMYLQVTGQDVAYETALFDLLASDPGSADRAAQAEANAKATCT